jgi:hypothetical protein
MFEMGSHHPFGHLKHKLWPKEGPEVKLVVWFLTTKSQESTRFRCVQVACDTSWKVLNEGYNFASDLISIRGLHTKLWGSKVTRISTLVISGLPLGSPGTKSHLDVSPVGSHRVYYKGEGGGFLQVRTLMSLVSSSCPWLVLAPKVHIKNFYPIFNPFTLAWYDKVNDTIFILTLWIGQMFIFCPYSTSAKPLALLNLLFEAYISLPNWYIKINMPVQHWGKTLGMNGSNISNIEVVECH